MEMVDLIVYGLVGLVIFGSWVANAVKKAEELRARYRRMTEQQGTAHGSGESGGTPEGRSVDELAMKRRQRIKEMAGNRRVSLERGGVQPARQEPDNLTLAQRIERDRAREQYRLRAEALQKQRIQSRKRTRPAVGAIPPATSVPARSRPTPSVHATTVSTSPQRSLAVAGPARRSRRSRQRAPVSVSRLVSAEPPRPRVASIPCPSVPEPRVGGSILAARLRGGSLKQAVLFKEVLDTPLGLRSSF